VPVCAGGYVSLYNASGSVSLIADLQGYYSTTAGYPFVPVTPTRLLDTREKGSTGPLHANATDTVGTALYGRSAGASVLVNITGVAPSSGTWLSAFGSGGLPATSNLDLTTGETRPVLAAVPVYSDTNMELFRIHNYAGQVGVVVDMAGYFG